jgi:tetratricopeptide (TPR) repeat protein
MLRNVVACSILLIAATANAAGDNGCLVAEDADSIISQCTAMIDGGALKGKALAQAHGRRGYGYERQKAWDRALPDLNKAIELDAGNQTAYYVRARVFDGTGDHKGAVADLTKAIELDSHPQRAFVYRGKSYIKLGQTDQAIADFNTALGLDGMLSIAFLNRGIAYAKSGNLDAAIADFTAAIDAEKALVEEMAEYVSEEEEPPRFAEPYYHRGLAHEAKGDKQAALDDFTQAMSVGVSTDEEREAQAQAEQHAKALSGGQ